jgi:hypothetical protein
MRAAKVDANQASIVKALRAVGATVQHLHKVGGGCPDLLVGFKSENYLLEIKQPKGKTNELQDKWHKEWNGCSFVVRTPEEAFDAIGAKVLCDGWKQAREVCS